MKYFITLSLVGLTSLSTLSAQLFKRVMDRAADKIEQRVEDKIVEGISTEIANRAVRPLDNVYDQIFREQYKATYGKEWDDEEYENDEERMNAMQAMLNSMYGNVELPESYTFDFAVEIETYDYGEKKPNKMKMLFNSNSGIFAMVQAEEDESLIVFDAENDIMTIYNQKEKTAMAMPSVMKMAGAFAASAEYQESQTQYKFEKHKTKKILGYEAQGYKAESEEDKSEFYVSDQLGFSWRESFGQMLQKSAPNLYKSHDGEYMDGFLLEAKSKRKKDGKESKWETKKVEEKTTTINNKDYKLSNQAMMGN